MARPLSRRRSDLRGPIAAATHHVAVYGLVHGDAGVAAQLAPYLTHRSTLRFRLGQTLPTGALTKAIRQKAQDLDDAL